MLEHIDDVKQVVDNEEDSKKQKVADAAKIVAPKIFIINVSQILDTSNAAKQGVRVGDCIVAIGDRIVAGLRLSEIKKMLGNKELRPSPLVVRILPYEQAADLAKAYIKDGISGLLEFRSAILRGKKKAAVLEVHNGKKKGAEAHEETQGMDKDSDEVKPGTRWKQLVKKHALSPKAQKKHESQLGVAWGRDLDFEEEEFVPEECFSSSGRYARISIYASYKQQYVADSLSQEILLEDERNRELLLPLQYFFGQDPANKSETMNMMEKMEEDDVLIGQTVVELPSIIVTDATGENDISANTPMSKNQLLKYKLEKYWKRHKATCPLTIFSNASEAAYGSDVDVKHRAQSNENLLLTDGTFPLYGEAGEIEIEYGWTPIRKGKDDDVKMSLTVQLAGIGISLIDKTPQELLYFTLQSISLMQDVYGDGRTDYEFKINDLQIANQLPLCQYNILLGQRFNTSKEEEGPNRPVLHVSAIVVENGKAQDVTMFDTFAVSLQALQLKLDDVWLVSLLHFLPDLLAEDLYSQNMRIQASDSIDIIMNNIENKYYQQTKEIYVLDLGAHDNLFDDPVFHCCVIGKSDAELASEGRVYFRLLHLHPISINITFSSSGDIKLSEALLGDGLSTLALRGIVDAISNMVTNVDEAPFRLDALYIPHMLNTWDKFSSTITEDYMWKSLTQIYKIFFSLEFFGNPVGLITNLGSGVIAFFYEPAMGLMKSPKEFAKGMQKGTANLLKSSVKGLFHTAGKITESVSKGVKFFAFDEEYVKKQRKRSPNGPKDIREGLEQGIKDLGGGIFDAVKGVVYNPYRKYKKDGIKGAAVGLFQGMVGLVVKPAAGALDSLTHIFQGIKNTANMFDKQKRFMRHRLPRYFSRGILARFSRREAEGRAFTILTGISGEYIYHVQLNGYPANIVILTTHVLCCYAVKQSRKQKQGKRAKIDTEDNTSNGFTLLWSMPTEKIHTCIPRGHCIALREGSKG